MIIMGEFKTGATDLDLENKVIPDGQEGGSGVVRQPQKYMMRRYVMASSN